MGMGWARIVRRVTAASAPAMAAAALGGCGAHQEPARPGVEPPTEDKVELTQSQLKAIKVEPISEHSFSPQRTAFGSIDFNEDRAVQVFSNYPGKILQTYADIGTAVTKGQPLYTIESPDLVQAESTLIAAAGVLDLTTKALDRDRQLKLKQGIADKDLDQAASDQMTAEGNLRAARAAALVFGKTPADLNKVIASRVVDGVLVVKSPLSGRVTARTAQVGLLVQPGSSPAPFSVADLSTVWMNANVAEDDAPAFHPGQPVRVKVDAFAHKDFEGRVAVVGPSVDAPTHTVIVRTVVSDPHEELKPGMMATFVIGTSAPAPALALPPDGLVRNGDGSMNAWVTADGRHFFRRTVTVGQLQDGFDQILSGVNPGELVVAKGAVFLSNMAAAASSGD